MRIFFYFNLLLFTSNRMGLLPESGILMDFSGYARAPHQEYTQIVVKANEVIIFLHGAWMYM